MAPLLISGVSSLASSILDRWTHLGETRAVAEQQPRVGFDSLLNARRIAGPVAIAPAELNEATRALMQQLVAAPEISAALGGQNLPPGSQLELGANGEVCLRLANGYIQPLSLLPQTQAMAAQVRAAMAAPQG